MNATRTPIEPPSNAGAVASIAPLLTLQQAAELVGLQPETVRAWARSGKFPQPRSVGRQLRWLGTDVVAWLRALPKKED